jgi:hypothetical protein
MFVLPSCPRIFVGCPLLFVRNSNSDRPVCRQRSNFKLCGILYEGAIFKERGEKTKTLLISIRHGMKCRIIHIRCTQWDVGADSGYVVWIEGIHVRYKVDFIS